MKQYKVRFSGDAYDKLYSHLFPGDALEAIAFAPCGHLENENEEVFTVHEIILYPYEKCTVRAADRVEWSPTDIIHLFEECRKKRFKLMKIHCHPDGFPNFSTIDDKSDNELSETLSGWVNYKDSIVSLIMLPDKSLFGRIVDSDLNFFGINSIIIAGDDILCFSNHLPAGNECGIEEDMQLRTRQAFGDKTTNILKNLKIGVVGCSGTGSIVAELLGRLGVGQLILVDHDKVERKNLNRILNTKLGDAQAKKYKVNVLKEAIESIGSGTVVNALTEGLHSFEAYLNIASCDIVFGCMDTVDGRYLLNRIGTYFCSPYFDIGVGLKADGSGGINEIIGRVDYIKPGGSSLLSRERYTIDQLKAADLARTDPKEYEKQLKEGYVKNAEVESPAVISINMTFASIAVTELLARIHPFRDVSNSRYASTDYSISGSLLITRKDGKSDNSLRSKVGLGARTPALDSPSLILPKKISFNENFADFIATSKQSLN